MNFMALGLMSAVTLLAPVRFRVTFASVGGRWAAWGGGGGWMLGWASLRAVNLKRKYDLHILIFHLLPPLGSVHLAVDAGNSQ